jgi:ferredoxin-NADP reductase/predicted pyridoxine 5'-phosphate oxidase superfamily flavin-nucleotide-binding protein
MAFSMAMLWNQGEVHMHELLRVPPQDNPTSSMLTSQASFMLQHAPLLAFGTLDDRSRPWATLWGGSPGFSEPLGGGFIGTRTLVDSKHDPVVQALVSDAENGDMMHHRDDGKLIAGLAIDLMTRKRVKIAGRVVASNIQRVNIEAEAENNSTQMQIQLVTRIEQSLGNCPKYLNQYDIAPALVKSELVWKGASLSPEAKALISRADMFFLSTLTNVDMDVNHRGGLAGFVRIVSSTEIVYPEYSGNRLYQSLGNLHLDSRIGVTFPDYETGDVLYLTGTASIHVGKEAAEILPGSSLVVKVKIGEVRFVAGGLPFRGVRKTPSPYNPLVRRLAKEGNARASLPDMNDDRKMARMIKKEVLTPTIARFTFSVPEGIAYAPGQWVALDFKEELDTGYEHMRDDDPTSLNDNFVRTFTISSTPRSITGKEKDFAITIRKGGPVTKFLFQQNERAGFEVPILGVGGMFEITQSSQGLTPFIAGGVGITPLLPQLPDLDVSAERFGLLWTLRAEDAGLARDTFERYPQLMPCTELFFTGGTIAKGIAAFGATLPSEVTIVERRLFKSDVEKVEAEKWYLCAGKGLREQVLTWLEGRTVVFEDFNY